MSAEAVTDSAAIAAVDLGATSGRVMLGVVAGGRIELHQAHRFENRLERRSGHLAWDVDELWAQVRQGLSAAQELARSRGLAGLASIGIDSWAVDYALVGPDGERIGDVIAYRDERTEDAAERVAAQVEPARQFALTGIAQQPFNTLYQLSVDPRLRDLPAGTSLLLVPDLIAFLLTGERRLELTNASTTGMFDASERTWPDELLAAARVDRALLPPLVAPGERIGTLTPELAAELGIDEVPVLAVGSHDTASAVLAVPAPVDDSAGSAPVAFISSGTWSLIGLELMEPVATEDARSAGFTNEGGVDGTVRFLKNVAGMWLVTESIRQWQEEGLDIALEPLLDDAAAEPASTHRIDPTDPQFLPPGRMADRVLAAMRPVAATPETTATTADAAGAADAHPRTPAQVVRCILESLAMTYRQELTTACRLAEQPLPARLHVVGGGSRNALLNQLTADALGIEVVAGPMEATALGNIALQARTLDAVASHRGALRDLVRRSVDLQTFSPS